MISWLAALVLPYVGERFAKAVAWIILGIAALLLFLGIKAAYDSAVVEDWLDDSREEFRDREERNEERATKNSDARRAEHEERIRTTEELIDEAIENGCAVGEYLASDGSNCVRS